MNQVDLERVWELNWSAPFPSFSAPLLPKTTANEQFFRLRSWQSPLRVLDRSKSTPNT